MTGAVSRVGRALLVPAQKSVGRFASATCGLASHWHGAGPPLTSRAFVRPFSKGPRADADNDHDSAGVTIDTE